MYPEHEDNPSSQLPINIPAPKKADLPAIRLIYNYLLSKNLRKKDYRHDAQQKTLTLQAEVFIRRFLLHVLPVGFQRIRYYGFLANRY